MSSPFSVDNYTYLNNLLKLKEANRLEAEKKLTAAQKAALLAQIEIARKQFEQAIPPDEANLKKLARASEMLNDDEKRRLYDAGLSIAKKTPVQVVVQDQGDHSELVPLVSMDKLIALFESMKNDPKYKDLIKAFNYTKVPGNPTKHIFTFPTEEAADAFVQALFDKNMAMYPDGSQDLKPSPSPKPSPNKKTSPVPETFISPIKTQSMKEQLLGSKSDKKPVDAVEEHSDHHHAKGEALRLC